MTPSRRSVVPSLVAIAGVLLGACATADAPRYYTLVPARVEATAAAQGPDIELLPVDVPAQVDVHELVIRQGAGELARVGNELWSAPLPDEVHAALAAQLRAQFGVREVGGLPRAGVDARRVRVVVRRFEAFLNHRVDVEAGWTISAAGSSTEAPAAIACETRLRETVGEGYPALVAGYQRALARLATDIGGALNGGACPAASPANR